MKYSATQKPKALEMVNQLLEHKVAEEKALLTQMQKVISVQIEKNRLQEEKRWRSKSSFTASTIQLEPLPKDFSSITFDVIPENNGIDGVIGYCDSATEIIGYSELKLLVKLHPNGYFQARNGDRYEADCFVTYTKGKPSHVTIYVDFSTQTYSVVIDTNEKEHMLAKDYAFGSYAMTADDLVRLSLTVNNYAGFRLENHHFK